MLSLRIWKNFWSEMTLCHSSMDSVVLNTMSLDVGGRGKDLKVLDN